jgi:hypothetical protein
MFFVVQRIETKVEGKDEPQVSLGCVSEHTDRKEADEKATDCGKNGFPGEFYVTQALAVVRPSPKLETL